MNNIVIGTSIPPYEIEKSKECVASWIKSGFGVISFNSGEEIKILKPFFEDTEVEFCEIGRSAIDVCGKELPYIQDILEGVALRSDCICGYCNADIYLHGVTQDFIEFMMSESENSVLLIHRNEVKEYSDIEKGEFRIHFDGFDLFFGKKEEICDIFENDEYVQSTWDTLILELCKKKGLNVKTIVNPIAFHKMHKVRWNSDNVKRAYRDYSRRYEGKQEPEISEIIKKHYHNLLKYSQYVCYSKKSSRKVLVVSRNINIPLDELEEVCIEVSSIDDDRFDYDYVIYAKEGINYSKIFFDFIFYIYDTFQIRDMNIGPFFWSTIDGVDCFNQLNKNLYTLNNVIDELNLWTKTVYNNRPEDIDIKKMMYPVVRKEICLTEEKIVRKIRLPERIYLMPAGYRASEWIYMNSAKIAIEGLIDNDTEKCGSLVEGLKIGHISEIERIHEIGVIITTKYYQDEIKKQLKSFGKRIISFDADRILYISNEAMVYYLGSED